MGNKVKKHFKNADGADSQTGPIPRGQRKNEKRRSRPLQIGRLEF